MNFLYYGDNLPILRDHVATGSIDLVYLDPPFNSSRSYNVLFKDESGKEPEARRSELLKIHGIGLIQPSKRMKN